MNKRQPFTPAMLVAAAEGRGVLAGMPGAIEASEKMGQIQLVRSTNMPLKLRPSKDAFEAIGFKFGKKIDDVFQEAELPEGWERKATDHSMWSDILDQHGRKRVAVFYKAAFYDRSAHASLEARFSVGNHYDPEKQYAYTGAAITDGGKVVKFEPHADDKDWASQEALANRLQAELERDRPDWMNPVAYWDEAA